MVAEEGLTVSGVEEVVKSDPPFAKNKIAKATPEKDKSKSLRRLNGRPPAKHLPA
jgi:hypothetical protein